MEASNPRQSMNDGWRSVLQLANVGNPVTRGGVSLFPVFTQDHDVRPVRAGVDATTDRSVELREREDGQVPTLIATSTSAVPVLFPQGDTVVGGLQNRTLNVSVLLEAGVTMIPVSCVEVGRCCGTRDFEHGSTLAPRRVRRVTSDSVAHHVRADHSRHSDQGAVWSAIDGELHRTGTHSANSAVHDIYREANGYADELADLGPLPDQTGVVVTRGARVLGVEVFGTPQLLERYWRPIIGSYRVDIGREGRGYPSATRALRFLDRIARTESTEEAGVGLGREHHFRTDRFVAHALTWDDDLVHLAGFAR